MNREFTRKELYELIWSQPMRTVAASIGISDVALAKQCKKANIPVPNRGYWARQHAGKPTVQIPLPPRFPGSSDRIGGSRVHYCGCDWPEKFRAMAVPPVPTFDEELSAVEERARKLVGRVRWSRKFEPSHPLVAKLLTHDEERRKEFIEWNSAYHKPRYDDGIERRRLLIINTLFLASARLGCRPSISTSKYTQDTVSERNIDVKIGESYIYFTIEPIHSKREDQKERLRLAFGRAEHRETATKFWEDNDEGWLEDQLTEIVVQMLVSAEDNYRRGLVHHREWIIERKAKAEAELKRRQDEAEREERELQEKLMKERIEGLLSEARALDVSNQIRAYVENVLSRANELRIPLGDVKQWAEWARHQADRIDPVKNGTIAKTIGDCLAAG